MRGILGRGVFLYKYYPHLLPLSLQELLLCHGVICRLYPDLDIQARVFSRKTTWDLSAQFFPVYWKGRGRETRKFAVFSFLR